MPIYSDGFNRDNSKRVFVDDPRLWGSVFGTDYTLYAGTTTAHITGGTAGQVLSEFGWTTTALAYVAGSAADFGSSSDVGIPAHFLTDASGDKLQSPAVFGDDAHFDAAEAILGYRPTKLCMRVVAAFSVASANETNSGFGLVEAGGGIQTADDAMGVVFSNATTFGFRSGAASDAGAAVDNAWHEWRAVFTVGSTAEWFIDDATQGTLAIQGDVWPCAFGVHSLTTNRILFNSVHIWYE